MRREPVTFSDGDPIKQELLARHGGPAFVRRAREVHEAFEDVLARARGQRQQWLEMVSLRLATLAALAGDWGRLRPLLADDEQVEVLRRLHDELRPTLRAPVEATTSTGRLKAALAELLASLERFNRRWEAFLPTVDLTRVNALREGYNAYFVLEKECAVGRPALTKADFVKLPPLRTEDVARALPPLPAPRVSSR